MVSSSNVLHAGRCGRGRRGFAREEIRQPRIDLSVPCEASAIEMRPSRFVESVLEDRFSGRMRLPGPSEHRTFGIKREEPPQRLPVSIPEFGTSKAPADRSPSDPPHRGPPWRMEPDDGVCLSPDVGLDESIVAIDHPRGMSVHEGCDSMPEFVIGKRSPVLLVVHAIEL